MIPFILTAKGISGVLNGRPFVVDESNAIYPAVLKACQSGDVTALKQALDIKSTIVAKAKGRLTIQDGAIYVNLSTGLIAVHNALTDRILEMVKRGLNVDPMLRFLDNLLDNPSKRAVDELWGFMEACDLPVTDDGHFLAYKRVRDNYRDVHSGTMDNSVGKVLEMPRNMVDEDKNRTCSAGLHFCSYDYLKHFSGERIVVLKINPRDVVAIPADYNNSKGRTCRYEVVDELPVADYLPTIRIEANYTDKYANAPVPAVDEDEDDDFDDGTQDEGYVDIYGNELADYEIDDIVDEYNDGTSVGDIADQYDVDTSTVIQILKDNTEYPRAAAAKAVTPAAPVNAPNITGAVLSETQVRQIRSHLKDGTSPTVIGRMFGVSDRTVRRIRDGQAWRHVK